MADEILNVKILDKNAQTDAVKLIKGLRVAAENGATMINLSAGVFVPKEQAVPLARKLVQFHRRNPGIMIVAAAGNIEEFPDKREGVFLPRELSKVKIPKEIYDQDLFNDIVFLLESGNHESAEKLIIELILRVPGEELEENVFRLRRALLYQVLAGAADDNTARTLSKKSESRSEGLLDYSVFQMNWELSMAKKERENAMEHYREGRFREAARHHRMALRVHERFKRMREIRFDCLNIGLSLLQPGMIKDASTMLQRSARLAKVAGDRKIEGFALFGLAVIHKKSGDKAAARETAKKAQGILEDAGASIGGFEKWLNSIEEPGNTFDRGTADIRQENR